MKGPFTKYIDEGGETYTVPMHYRAQTWYRSDTPERLPLPYEVEDARVDHSSFPAGYTGVNVRKASQFCVSDRGCHPYCPGSLAEVNNKAYATFVSRMQTGIGIGTDVAEFKQTFDMVKSWATAARRPMTTFAQTFRRTRDVFRHHGVDKDSKGRTPSLSALSKSSIKDVAKAASNLLLQFRFGVQPLYQDLNDLLDLQNSYQTVSYDVDAGKSMTTECTVHGYKTTEQYIFKLGVRYAATVRITDENAALRVTFGIENPTALAWELLPYSFLLDWIYPVSLYISSMTDFHGREIVSGYKNIRSRGVCNYTNEWTSPARGYTAGGFSFRRLTGAAAYPKMVLQPLHLPNKLSAVRSITALALAVQRIIK